jgi:hypothetical protein
MINFLKENHLVTLPSYLGRSTSGNCPKPSLQALAVL